ncbi:MAG: hypothetical protein ACTSWF_14270 [Candidatus Freyarchaeota archaeon]
MKRLTEEDRERVSQKLKDADTSVSVKLLTLYRHLAKASRDGIQTLDLGIPTVGEKLSLTKRAREYLKDQEILLDKISPKVLIQKTFSEEDEAKTVAEIWESFLKYPELPFLTNEQTLRNAITEGVKNGIFGLKTDEKVHYAEIIFSTEITEESLVLRKEKSTKT